MYSFGIKVQDKGISRGPGIMDNVENFCSQLYISAPNAYAVPPPKDAPAYSLAARSKEQKRYITPAPGNYEVRF